MLLIDFNNNLNTFTLTLEEEYDSDIWNDFILLFRKVYLKFDKKIKKWICPLNKIEEILIWLEKKDLKYKLTTEAAENLKIFFIEKEREVQFFKDEFFDPSVLKNNVQLYPFQLQAIEKMVKGNRWYLADDPGLGKTLMTIALFSHWFKKEKIDSVFLIVRKGLSHHWKHEILNFSSFFKEEDIQIIDNSLKKQLFNKFKDKKIIIVSNHLLADIFASYRKDYDSLTKLSTILWNKPFVDINKEWGKKSICCVVDEAHELSNFKATVTKALLCHKRFFSYRLLISATPAINYFERWWASLNFLDPSLINMSFNAFRIWISKQIGNKWDPYFIVSYEPKNVDKIRQILKKIVIKRTKQELKDVIKSKKTIKPIYLEMPSLHREMYKEVFKFYLDNLESEYSKITGRHILNVFPFLIQVIDNPLLLKNKINSPHFNNLLSKWDIEQDARWGYIETAIKNHFEVSDKKIIIFDSHPLTLDLLYEKLKKYNPILVHGKLKDTEEEKYNKQQLFNSDSPNKIFLLSSLIGGAGWNLHKKCERAIAWSLNYDTVLFAQMQDRIHRITSENDVIFEPLILDNSLDNIRLNKNLKRIEINDSFLNKELNEEDILKLYQGIFDF